MLYDVVLVGGGIVGLATGYKLITARPDLKIAILEKESQLALHQTANNSGVIHSGLYYKPGSLKAINCIKGYHELVNFCKEEKIPYEITCPNSRFRKKEYLFTTQREIKYEPQEV